MLSPSLSSNGRLFTFIRGCLTASGSRVPYALRIAGEAKPTKLHGTIASVVNEFVGSLPLIVSLDSNPPFHLHEFFLSWGTGRRRSYEGTLPVEDDGVQTCYRAR